MTFPPARYELCDWPAGPRVDYEAPVVVLGLFLSSRNQTLWLERTLADLRESPDAWSPDNGSTADRSGERITLRGDWSDEELELGFAEFDAAGEEFLTWIRSNPPAGSHDALAVIAGWLGGTIDVDEDRPRFRRILRETSIATLPRSEVERRVRARTIADFGPLEEQATIENVAWRLAASVGGVTDSRVAASAIAQLAPLLANAESQRAQLILPFVELAADAQRAEGRPALVADVEHRIAAAAARLSAIGRA